MFTLRTFKMEVQLPWSKAVQHTTPMPLLWPASTEIKTRTINKS